MNILRCLMLFASLVVASSLYAGEKKGKNLVVSFHIETDANENPKMIFQHPINGKERFFRRSAEISSKDIVAFSPFPADDGVTYGTVFSLRETAKNRLDTLTRVNQGKLLCATVNGQVIDVVTIDRPVSDGMIVIWQGINAAIIKEYDKMAPRIGAEKKKK